MPQFPRAPPCIALTDVGARAVFPGGFLPTLTFMVETLAKGSQGRLVVDSVSNIGPHYARTLREWRRRFEARFEDAVVPGACSRCSRLLPDVLMYDMLVRNICSVEGGVPGGDGHGRRESERGD